jgi:hypothetical protein
MQILGMDVVGPFKPSRSGNRFIITFVDHFTGFAWAFPVPRATAETIARLLITHLVPVFGCPEKILSDQGSNFMSELLSSLVN